MLVSFFSPTILCTWPILTWERFKPTVPRSIWQDSFDVFTREKTRSVVKLPGKNLRNYSSADLNRTFYTETMIVSASCLHR